MHATSGKETGKATSGILRESEYTCPQKRIYLELRKLIALTACGVTAVTSISVFASTPWHWAVQRSKVLNTPESKPYTSYCSVTVMKELPEPFAKGTVVTGGEPLWTPSYTQVAIIQ